MEKFQLSVQLECFQQIILQCVKSFATLHQLHDILMIFSHNL